MIELRWVERDVPCSWGKNGKVDGMSRDRVLQYRQWLIRLDAGGAMTPLPEPIEWSDWQDVPAVREE